MADEDEVERKPFAMVLQEMRKGGLHTELGDELAALVLQCQETGKKGSLTITLNVDPGDDGVMVVDDKITVKAPRHDTGKSIFWADEGGNLVRENPNQLGFGLRGVDGGRDESNGGHGARGEAGS